MQNGNENGDSHGNNDGHNSGDDCSNSDGHDSATATNIFMRERQRRSRPSVV